MIQQSLRITEQTRVLLFSFDCTHCLFQWISPRSCNWMFVFLQSAGLKKIYMVINWGVSLFNVWVTVRSTVQNSLSASYLQENCQWQKQNYDFFFSLFFLWISKPQNLTTDKLHSFPASLQSSQQRTVSVFKRMKVSRSVGRPVSWALCCERWAPHFPVNAHWCGK